jgi:hypothetical protein
VEKEDRSRGVLSRGTAIIPMSDGSNSVNKHVGMEGRRIFGLWWLIN